MSEINKFVQKGLLILVDAWGENCYPAKKKLRPLLPTEDVGAFLQPSIPEVITKLKRELGDSQYKQFIIEITSLDSEQKIIKFLTIAGVQPPSGMMFFYSEAIYAMLAFDKNMVKSSNEIRELLVTNLLSFDISQAAVDYLLEILDISFDDLFPLLERMLGNESWIVRENVITFFYGLHCGRLYHHTRYSISKNQWQQIQIALGYQLKKEEHPEVRRLIKRELNYLSHFI